MSLTFCLFVVVTITILRFFYIVVWRSIREVNDNLLARIVFLESCLLSFFYSITRLETQVYISGYSWPQINESKLFTVVQVNLFQKHSFLNQLTHNMTTDCSLSPDFSTKKIQVQNMLCTKIVFCFCFGIQNNFCTQHVLNLYFSCTEVGNQWTIFRHIVG